MELAQRCEGEVTSVDGKKLWKAASSAAPCWVAQTIIQRMGKMLRPLGAAPPDLPQCEALRKHYACLPPQLAVTAMRMVLNAWCTSHRMHDRDRPPCLWGCEVGEDTLSHYLVCPAFWQPLDAALLAPREVWSPVFWGICPARFCTDPLNAVAAQIIASVAYHAVRQRYRVIGGPLSPEAAAELGAEAVASALLDLFLAFRSQTSTTVVKRRWPHPRPEQHQLPAAPAAVTPSPQGIG